MSLTLKLSNSKTLPLHISIICDGNRRWARKRHLPEFSGHKYAVEKTIEKLIDRALELKIPYLTFWVLSTENWKRGKKWINRYFQLMSWFFKKYLQKLLKKGIKIRAIGDLTKLPSNIQKIIQALEEKSKQKQKMTVIMAINYGGRDEIIRAINKLAANKGPVFSKGRAFSQPFITEKELAKYLDTASIPDPDLVIRTGKNNSRLSGFMAWQAAYAELYFTDTLFPDFTPQELDKAILWFQQQKRNFGK